MPQDIEELERTPIRVPVNKEKSLFKFKKTTKILGGVEVSSIKKWAMFLKPQIKDDTLFIHFLLHRDKEFGTVTGIQVFQGFMKGERFVPTSNRLLSNKGFNDYNIITRLKEQIERFVNEGYSQDVEQYIGGEPGNPSYYQDPEEVSEDDNPEENEPEQDIKQFANMVLKKKETITEKIERISKSIGEAVKTPLNISETIETEKTLETGFSLFKRKSK